MKMESNLSEPLGYNSWREIYCYDCFIKNMNISNTSLMMDASKGLSKTITTQTLKQ